MSDDTMVKDALIGSLSARLNMLEGIVRGLLKLHEAHHNHPEHAFARSALAALEQKATKGEANE